MRKDWRRNEFETGYQDCMIYKGILDRCGAECRIFSPPSHVSPHARQLFTPSLIFRLSFLHACLEGAVSARFENKFWLLDGWGRWWNYWNLRRGG